MTAVTDVAKSTPSTKDHQVDQKSSDIEFEIETITPDIAVQLLETSEIRKQRLKSRRTMKAKDGEIEITSDPDIVKGYAEIMKAGAWVMNLQPILIDREGNLIDGITRLEACVLSGVSIKTNIARNVRADTLHTIDQHRKRLYTGVLESRGVSFAGAIQSTMTKLIRIENGILGKDHSKIPWPLFDRVHEGNPELDEAVSISEGSRGSLLHSTPRPTLAFMAIKAGKREKFRFFIGGLKNVENFPLGNPVRMLANQLKAEMRRVKMAKEAEREYTPMHIDTVLAISIMAFNDFCNDVVREEEYFWQPEYGKAKRFRNNRQKVRDLAPDNLGLPEVEGYPGLKFGKYISGDGDKVQKFEGETAKRLKKANDEDSGEAVTVWRTVTPKKAREYLALNRDNRALSDSHKRTIAQDIRNGHWMLNAQPICFTGDPDDEDAKEKGVRLLNGQHRLHGCIEADMPIEVPIGKNVADAAFSTYDAHSKKMRHKSGSEADDRVLQAAARLQWKEDNNIEIFSTGINPSASEIVSTINNHPGLATGYAQARVLKNVGSAGIMTYLIYHVTQDRPDIAEDFLSGLHTGSGLEARNPVLGARTKIVGHRTAKKSQRVKIPRKEILKTLINSWRDYKVYRDEVADENKQQDLL